MSLRVGIEPLAQVVLATEAKRLQMAMQVGQVEYAERRAGAFENLLIAPLGLLQPATCLLFGADIAQHPDEAVVRVGSTQGAAADAEGAGLAVLRQLQQKFFGVVRVAAVVRAQGKAR